MNREELKAKRKEDRMFWIGSGIALVLALAYCYWMVTFVG